MEDENLEPATASVAREGRAEVMMHPDRLRILNVLHGRRLTTQQIGALLGGDVPQATLYRHLSRLAGVGMVEVVEERRVHGTVERVYAVVEEATALDHAEVADATPEQARGYFGAFIGMLLAAFDRYTRGGAVHLDRDGVMFYGKAVYLTDDEWRELRARMRELIHDAQRNGPGEGRRRRTVAALSVPDPAGAAEEKEENVEP